jgi:hypothetical protein
MEQVGLPTLAFSVRAKSMAPNSSLGRFLVQSSRAFGGCIRGIWPVSGKVDPSEPIGRFLLDKDDFYKSKAEVHPNAFHPTPRTGKTSVFRIRSLRDGQVWFIGRTVALLRERHLYGRADLRVADVIRAGLAVAPTFWPIRHADLVNWPLDKAKLKSAKQELAAASSLHLLP